MKKDKNCCKFRPHGVQCYEADKAHCDKCGWNPEVEEKRKEKLRKKMVTANEK